MVRGILCRGENVMDRRISWICFRSAILRFAALAACFAALAVASPDKKPSAAGLFVADKGKLSIQLNGQTIGHEEFSIEPSGAGWMAKGTTDLKPPQSSAAKVSGTLVLQDDGAPISYEWSSAAEKTNAAKILFANGVAKITLLMQGARPFEQDLTFGAPVIAVLDNNLYHQYAVLARVYDWSKRGVQSFPVRFRKSSRPAPSLSKLPATQRLTAKITKASGSAPPTSKSFSLSTRITASCASKSPPPKSPSSANNCTRASRDDASSNWSAGWPSAQQPMQE